MPQHSPETEMDTIQLHAPADQFIRWPNGGGFQQVVMSINDEPLIDIVRRIELPHVRREYDDRIAHGESPEELGDRDALAGQYLYLPPVLALPPSRNFFGEPYDHGFRTNDDDPVNKKSLILQCTCGITSCWFLVADIRVHDNTVTWANFQQFHREWPYGINPFVFDREAYECEFAKLV